MCLHPPSLSLSFFLSGADQSKKKDAAGEGEGGEGEEKTKPEPVSLVKVRGCVLHFTGLTEGKSREDIREDLLPFGTVAFVDFDRGKTEVSGQSHSVWTEYPHRVCVAGLC